MNGRTNSNNNTTGFEIEVPLDPVTNVSTSPGNGQVELTWTDPLDKYAATEGEVAESPNPVVSQWDHTRVVRKENTQPIGPNDGVIVLSSDVRNQYQSTSYVDSGLTNDTLYHYGLFACNTAGLFSAGAFGSATPKAGTPLSQLPEGSIIKILENGSPVEFYLAKHSYEPSLNGEGRELVVRKNIYDLRAWNSSNLNTYATSTIDNWLNSSYIKLLSTSIRGHIGTTKFYYTPGYHDYELTTLERAIFIVSLTELDESYGNNNINSEGSALPIASTLKRAYFNGRATAQWTRTPYKLLIRGVLAVRFDGQPETDDADGSKGSRPAFTLPNTIAVDSGMNVIA